MVYTGVYTMGGGERTIIVSPLQGGIKFKNVFHVSIGMVIVVNTVPLKGLYRKMKGGI